jgi:hypothetical protein
VQKRSNDLPPGGATSTGAGLPGTQAEQASDWQLSASCGVGFVREMKPDHPGGYYECRLLANPPCEGGWGHQAAFDGSKPHQFKYACVAPNPGSSGAASLNCPQGWDHSAPQTWKYHCTSKVLTCGPNHQLDGIHRVSQPPLFKYRCKAS